MSMVAANAFRQGYTTRTFTGMDIYRYRDDNVQRTLKSIEFKNEANDVIFNIKFNINEI
jgi:hypothetical protein